MMNGGHSSVGGGLAQCNIRGSMWKGKGSNLKPKVLTTDVLEEYPEGKEQTNLTAGVP